MDEKQQNCTGTIKKSGEFELPNGSLVVKYKCSLCGHKTQFTYENKKWKHSTEDPSTTKQSD